MKKLKRFYTRGEHTAFLFDDVQGLPDQTREVLIKLVDSQEIAREIASPPTLVGTFTFRVGSGLYFC